MWLKNIISKSVQTNSPSSFTQLADLNRRLPAEAGLPPPKPGPLRPREVPPPPRPSPHTITLQTPAFRNLRVPKRLRVVYFLARTRLAQRIIMVRRRNFSSVPPVPAAIVLPFVCSHCVNATKTETFSNVCSVQWHIGATAPSSSGQCVLKKLQTKVCAATREGFGDAAERHSDVQIKGRKSSQISSVTSDEVNFWAGMKTDGLSADTTMQMFCNKWLH